MTLADIHRALLPAVIALAEGGATAKDLADYLEQAAKGMRVNAAFGLSGTELAAALRPELAP